MAAEYQRLPGRAGSLLATFRLWLAKDHLLNLESNGYAESYRRYYFRDIQAIVVQRTDWGKIWNFFWGTLVVVTGLLSFWASRSNEAEWGTVAFFFCFLFALALVINAGLGPTCACHIQTAVQRDQLRSLRRLRATRKFIARTRPLIEAAQKAAPSAGPSNQTAP